MATHDPKLMAQALGTSIGHILYAAADSVVERKFNTPEGQAELADHLRKCGWTVTPPTAKPAQRKRGGK